MDTDLIEEEYFTTNFRVKMAKKKILLGKTGFAPAQLTEVEPV